MTDRQKVQRQYESVQQEINSWPESLRRIPSYHEMRLATRQHDLETRRAKRRKA